MFKTFVRIDQNTDVVDTMRRLEKRAVNGKLSPDVLQMVLGQSSRIIEDFFERGTALSKAGSQMRISRTIDGPGYAINIQARFGTKESMLERIIGVLRGRRHV